VKGTATTRFALAAVAVVALAPSASGPADDEDVPKRQPAVEWEREVSCDAAAELGTGTARPPRRCDIAVADGAVYLLEHSDAAAPGATFRLSRLDLDTGVPLWTSDVGPMGEIAAYDDIVVLSDKTQFEVYDAESGASRFRRRGVVTDVNRYSTLLLADGSSVTALDPVSGDELWSTPGALGALCRDIVIVVTAKADETGHEPYRVLDHRTGEERWTSAEAFDTRNDHITCGYGPYVYTTDGRQVHEWDAYSGWLNWSADVPGAGEVEIYREVVLVRSGDGGNTIVAIERDTGNKRWERPAGEVGTLVSIIGRVREDSTGVFTLHPLSGEIVNHTSHLPSTAFDVVASSDTRLVVATGSVVTAYGMNDLGVSWQLDVGGNPDDFDVTAGHLLVRTGSVLRAYR
jgi:outer membrane protein assembly factor BamB